MFKSLLMSVRNRRYDPMSEDGYDSKIPLHSDEAFQHGIHFNAKFIGSVEVPKPTSRIEIVTAMRRIRYEFKARAAKKRKVNLSVSVDGIKVCLCKKKNKNFDFNESKILINQSPIYRVFYVSHDSQDLKIFSFIARDNASNLFRCNVFKAYKKNQAMRIVRTIGQAFEVCHKLALQQRQQASSSSKILPNNVDDKTNPLSSPTKLSSSSLENDSIHKQTNNDTFVPNMQPMAQAQRYMESVQIPTSSNSINLVQADLSSEFALKHQMQFMQEQIQQMQNESELAFNQMKLTQEQLNIEISARIDAQNKNNQLLQRNRELLTHIQQLLLYTNELEIKLKNDSIKILPTRPHNLLLLPSLFSTLTPSNQQYLSSDSPDSGKGKEISCESISDPFLSTSLDQQINNSTQTFSINDDLKTQSVSIHDSSPNQQHISTYCSSSHSSSISIQISNTQQSINNNKYDHYDKKISNNSTFSSSPLRTVTNEFDPLMK